MSSISESMLMAYVDGESNPIDAARVEQAAVSDPELRKDLAEQQHLKSRLSARYDPILDEDVPERFRAMLTSNVVPIAPARERRAPGRMQMFTAMAASLAVGLLAGQIGQGGGGPIAVSDNVVFARGDLAKALETQLASEQPTGTETRIGVSFAAQDGRLCRTFDAAAMSGLACRGGEDWEVVMAMANDPSTASQYKQAGSGDAAVLGLAQEMMSGEPLGAAAERRARDLGWTEAGSR